jgi:hypothetical protein
MRKLYPSIVIEPLCGACFRCTNLLLQAVFPFKSYPTSPSPLSNLHLKSFTMSDLFVNLKAPNGVEYKQPIGLFINNEFVKSSSGEKITSINPTYAFTSSTAQNI